MGILYKIKVNPNNYKGSWRVIGHTARLQNSKEIELPDGTHRVEIAYHASFVINVVPSGVGKCNVKPHNQNTSILEGTNSFSFNTQEITVIPNDYDVSHLKIHYGPDISKTTRRVTLVKDVTFNMKVAHNTSFVFALDSSGSVDTSKSKGAATSSTTQPHALELNTLTIKIDRNGYLKHTIEILGGPQVHRTSNEIALVKGIRYYRLLVAKGAGFIFDVDETGKVEPKSNSASFEETTKTLKLKTTTVVINRSGYVGDLGITGGPSLKSDQTDLLLVNQCHGYVLHAVVANKKKNDSRFVSSFDLNTYGNVQPHASVSATAKKNVLTLRTMNVTLKGDLNSWSIPDFGWKTGDVILAGVYFEEFQASNRAETNSIQMQVQMR